MSHIAFFGTPDFAIPSLEAVQAFFTANHHELSMVVCQPDKPAQRGKHLHAPVTKVWAQQYGVPVYQPTTLKKNTPDGDAFFDIFTQAKIDLAIVVAYGRIIPKRFLDFPRCGFVNVHGSLLPRWRGAAPIQRAIEAGDLVTGVSIMDLVPELDAGDVYKMVSIPIESQDNSVTLFAKLSQLGAQTLVECLPGILDGTLIKMPQPVNGVTHAVPIDKSEGQIKWSDSAEQIVNRSRAMQPWPGTYTIHEGRVLRLFDASITAGKNAPGTIVDLKDGLTVSTGHGCVTFKEAQLEGKRRMSIRDLLNGYRLEVGQQFSEINYG